MNARRISGIDSFNNLYRSFIGFDDLFRDFEIALGKTNSYPPYNISKNEKNITIEISVSGFKRNEINVSVDPTKNVLTVSGKKETEDTKEYVVKTLATREFNKEFKLSDHVEVEDVKLEDGILYITLIDKKPAQKDILYYKIK